MRSTRGETHVSESLSIGNMNALGFSLRPLDPRATADNGAIQRVRKRQINHRDYGRAFFDETDLHGEVAVAVDEAVRAVERIDQPHARLAQAALGVDRLFGENTVARE